MCVECTREISVTTDVIGKLNDAMDTINELMEKKRVQEQMKIETEIDG